MRMIMQISMPTDVFNASVKDGSVGAKMHRILEHSKPEAAYFAELFGPRLRYSGFAFARELGSIIAGGPSPFIAALLVGWMAGAPWGVACYVILLSLITAFAIWCGPETSLSDIRADTPHDLAADAALALANRG